MEYGRWYAAGAGVCVPRDAADSPLTLCPQTEIHSSLNHANVTNPVKDAVTFSDDSPQYWHWLWLIVKNGDYWSWYIQLFCSDYREGLERREGLISRLSSSLRVVVAQQGEDGAMASSMEEEVAALKEQMQAALGRAARRKARHSELSRWGF